MLKRFGKNKKLLIGSAVALFAIVVAVVAMLIADKGEKIKKSGVVAGSELARAMTYDQFEDGDEDIDGTDYVKFGAFFLRDVDGDGYAEKIKGTCKQVGKEDTLYMELNVLTNGYLEDGVITISGNNFYLQTAIPKDSEVKDNVISNNTKQISLNQINNGTQKLLTGIVKSGDYSMNSQKFAAIGNDTSKMSGVNSVTLTGTHVAADGTRTAISKTVSLNMDWYGTTSAEIPNYINGDRNLNQTDSTANVVDEGNQQAVFEFNLGMQETNNQMILSKAHMSGTIPQLNGFDPISVETTSANVDFTYDADTRVFVAEKSAVLDDSEKVQNQCYDGLYLNNRYNKFKLKVVYPLEAYVATEDTVEIKIPVEGYYEGFNNANEEFSNPYRSNVAKGTIVITYSAPKGSAAIFDVAVGQYLASPSGRWIVSKKKPLKIYNGLSTEEKNDTYVVRWIGSTGDTESLSGIIMKETSDGEAQVSDEFIKADSSTESMDNFVANVGIAFNDPTWALGDDGWIKVYDDESGELIHEFTKSDWNKYSSNSPYKYDSKVKHVRVVTSKINGLASVIVYNIKEIDDDYVTENYTREQFDEFKYVKSTLVGYIDDVRVNLDTANATYEEPYSMVSVNLSKSILSTQETEKNMQIKISTSSDEDANQSKWKNGVFLLKLPKDIIDIEINSVVSSSSSIVVSSYESFEENGERFIKIVTSNDVAGTVGLTIDCNVTPDPRIPTSVETFELYAINEDAVDYYNATEDIYDVNGDLNTTEKVARAGVNVSLVSPNSLLTNQVASNYDDAGSVAIAPQVALVSKDKRSATVSVWINNNYSSTISDVQILGRVPFDGNKYAVTGEEMGSTFTATMTNAGLVLPDALKGVVKVYYSENGEATKDVSDVTNGWTVTPSDFSKVKSYLIDFGDYKLAKGEEHTISYDINIPEGLNYNQVAYSHHGVYFSLDTAEGKYKTRTEPNKVGFMIAKLYDLELVKYQKNKDNVVSGATYAVYEDGQDEAKTRVTATDGKLTFTGLFLDRTYVVKEIASPNEYELSGEVVKFTTSESDGKIVVTKLDGTVKSIQGVQPTADAGYVVKIEVEDEVKARLKVVKTESGTGVPVKGVVFKVTGEGLSDSGRNILTNSNGEVVLRGLRIGEEYTVEETKATGYYLGNSIKFKVVNTDGTYTVTTVDGASKGIDIAEEEDVPVVSVQFENEKIPTYDLEISKIKRVTDVADGGQQEETVYLQGAKFRLYKDGKEIGSYVTDENGKISISDLYQYIDGKDEAAVYVLKEVLAPAGYAKVKDISFKVDGSTGELKFVNTEGKEEKYTVDGTTVKLTIEDSPSFRLIKKDAETGERLAGIKFAIYNVDDEMNPAKNSKGEYLGTKEEIDGKDYYVVVTDSNGEITADLQEGYYKAVEVWAPDKYDISDSNYYFSIGAGREGMYDFELTEAHLIGGSTFDYFSDVVATDDGGYIVAGYPCSGTIYADNEVLYDVDVGGYTGILVKYNSKSEVEWSKLMPQKGFSQFQSVSICSDGGYIVGGSYTGGPYDLENGITLERYADGDDGLVIKYNSNGDAEWARTVKGSYINSIDSVAICKDGGYIVGGFFQSESVDLGDGITFSNHKSQGSYDSILIKYNENGQIEWAKNIGGAGDDRITSVQETTDGGYIVGGYFDSDGMDLGNGITLENYGREDGMIIKYNVNGDAEWATSFGGSFQDRCNSMVVSDDGGCVVAGYCCPDKGMYLGDIRIEPTSTAYNGIIIKYNSKGEVVWYNLMPSGSSQINSICKLKSGGYLVVGEDSSMRLNNGILINDTNSGMILRLTENGEVDWGKNVSEGYYTLKDVTETSDGEYIVGGELGGIDGNIGNNVSVPAKGAGDIVVARFGKVEVPSASVVKVHNTDSSSISSTKNTKDGGYVVAGTFSSNSVDFDNILDKSTEYKGSAIVKYAQNKEIEWAQKIGMQADDDPTINDIMVTGDGGYLVGGYYSESNLKITEDITLINKGLNDAFLIKYNSDGIVEWAKEIGSTSNEVINSITQSDDGGYIVGGYFQSKNIDLENGIGVVNNGNESGMVIKYNAKGEIVWARVVSGDNLEKCTIDSIIATHDNGYIIAGIYNLNNNINQAGFVRKYDSYGNAEWHTDEGIGTINQITELTLCNDGGCIVVGYGIYTDDNGNIYEDNTSDGFINKIGPNGEDEWWEAICGNEQDEVRAVKQCADGGYIMAVRSNSDYIELDNGSRIGNYSNSDGFIIKLTPNGDSEWSKVLGSSADDYVNSIEICDDGTYLVTGSFGNTTEIDGKKVFGEFILKLDTQGSIPEVQELKVKNKRKEFKITTDVSEISGSKGGSISGEDAEPYEVVKYGDGSINEIKMVPDEGYEIIGITVNGKEYQYTVEADGSFIMPAFDNMTEDKHIVVTYSLKDNKITINKVDKDTKEKLAGAKFKLDQIEERSEPDSADIIGTVTDNGQEYTDVDITNEITGKFGDLTNNGTYYFVQNDDGTVTPTNSKTYQVANGGTSGISSSTANSYVQIDLTGLTGQYAVVINARCSSKSGYDLGYATITETTTAPGYGNSTGSFMLVSGTVNNSEYTSGLLEGGKTYYLHFGYRKNASEDTDEDQVVINSIKLCGTKSVTYNFANNNGKYESTNQGKDSTVANSYIPIDLTKYTGKYRLTVNAEISSEYGWDIGYATVTENTTSPAYNSETGRFVYFSGTVNADDYSIDLQGGKMYYLHFGYMKDQATSNGDDKFTINSVNIALSDSDIYHVTVETNSDGQAIAELPFGKYNLTEIQAPDGYILDSTTKVIEFRGTEGAAHEFTIENEKKAQLVVQHYIKGTTTKLAEDESYEGIAGDKYTTAPRLDLEKYELEVDSNGEFVLPVNAVGTYKSGVTEITYYYVEKSIPLTVHHYIEGTTENVPLKAGGTASDVTGSGKEGETYTTSAIADDVLSDEYELVETPSNANGTYSGSEVVVNYYYKKVSRDVNLVKYKEDGVTPLEGAKFTVDGTEYITNANGRIQTKLEVGSHEVIEVEAPEGYKLPSNPKTSVTITKATTSEDINITNEKKTGTVTVHHYIEGTTDRVPLADGTLAVDETKTGNVGDIYATKTVENLSESYELVAEPDNASGTYVDGDIEVIYYYKAIPAVVTVHHYLEGTTTKLAEDVTINGLAGENYTTVAANVDNKYELVATPANASGKMTRDGVEVIYYYRLKSTLVLVHYYIEGTTTSLSDDKTIPGKVDDKYTTASATDIPSKYELVATPSNASGTMTVEQIVVTYYYRLKETGVDVHYYVEGTTVKVAEDVTISGRVDQKYTTTPATNVASKYELVATPDNASGTMTEARITVIYYYRLKDTSVLVHHYIEGTTTKLSNDVTINGKVDASYTTKVADDIPSKYELVSIPANASGVMTETQIVVTYYYRLKDTSVLVHHYVKDTTTSLSADVTIPGKVDASYTTKVADDILEQYELVGTPANASGTMTEAQIVVTYYYQLKSYPYTVNYLEKGSGNVLHEAKQGGELVYGSQVKAEDEKIDIDGYVYDSADKDVLTIGTGSNVINIYYVKRSDLTYKVNYLEKGTNEVLHEQKVQDGMTFEAEVEAANEVIEIDGYNYDSVDKPTLKITTGENVINVYYTKRTDLSYVVNYLEKGSNNVLNPQKNVGNKTFGEVVTSADEVIDIDGYNYDSVDKNSLKIGTGENVINVYYTKMTDLSYVVNYLEKGTNKVLNNPKTVNNVTFGTIITSENEKIDIDGYSYDSVDKATLTITTGTNVINLYYTKRTDLSYKVNYLEKDTNKVLHDQKTQGGMTFEASVEAADEIIDIDGYNFNSLDKETLKIGTGENIINIYYTKRNELSYTVNYLEKDTNKVIYAPKVTGNITFDDEIISANEVIPINGYSYDSVDKDKLVIGTGENVINIYYTKKDAKVTIHYYEEGTTNKLSEDVVIDGRVDDAYTTKAADDVPIKYELVGIPDKADGVMTEETIEVIYYYRVKDAVVNVRYLEKGTDVVLASEDRLDGKVDDPYVVSAKVIDGYTMVEHSGNENGKFEVDPITITYYYLYNTRATVQYIDKITGQILEQSTTEGLEGEEFVTESKNFDNYILVEEPTEKTVKMTKDEIVLKYYYIHVSGGVIEKHIDVISGEILANETHDGNEGDAYDIKSRTFDGYDLVEDRLPNNAQGTMNVDVVEVTYYYIYRTKVTAEYIDKATGDKLAPDVVQDGHEGDAYVTERKVFDDYKLVEVPANADGSMTKDEITVTYYYVHTSGGVIVNHLDVNTGKQLRDEAKIEGYEGDPYETHEENIPGYTLVQDKYPANATGTMKIEKTRVDYYYAKQTEVNVKYVDKETGDEVAEKTNIPGNEGDNFTTEPKDVPGYDLVEEPEQKDGTMTAEPIELIYYYRRPAKVIAKYFDNETKEEIATEEKQDGHQNDEYTTEAKDIKYYKLLETPSNANGTMTVTVTKDENGNDIVEDTTYVNYYYRKLDFNLSIDKKVASVTVNGNETTINGDLAKIEVYRKDFSTAKVEVKYTIKVTNNGELSGKANILEDIPTGMTMGQDKNSGWKIKGTTATRETKDLQPGESEEYIVVLDWENGANNIGMKENTASIISTENEAGYDEKDTTDNEDKADVIVAISTGGHTYIIAAGGILLVLIALGCGVYVIKKRK